MAAVHRMQCRAPLLTALHHHKQKTPHHEGGSRGSPRNTRRSLQRPHDEAAVLSFCLAVTSATFSQSAPATVQSESHAASPQLAAQFGTGNDTGSVTASSSGATISLNRQNSMKHRDWAAFGRGGPSFLHQASTPTTPPQNKSPKAVPFFSPRLLSLPASKSPQLHHDSPSFSPRLAPTILKNPLQKPQSTIRHNLFS